MPAVLNYYSFLFVLIFLFIVAAAFIIRRDAMPRDYVMLGGIALILLLAWVALHPRQSELSMDAESFKAQIGAGMPVLLEFQSPYCLACTAIEPAVDRIEEEYSGQLKVLRVNIQSDLGRELTGYYGFEYTPTFIFFDAQGQEIWREVGSLDETRLRNSLNE